MRVRNSALRRAFTLVELLVVISIIGLLVALLLPSLKHARRAAKIVVVHSDLRSIELALDMYGDDNRAELPVTRFSCSTRAAYELPVELAAQRYLPGEQRELKSSIGDVFVEAVAMHDVFNPETTYLYRAPGSAIQNESILMEPPFGASLWVPDDFPYCDSDTGRYYADPKESPARYAVWSWGPDLLSPKLASPPGRPVGRAPLPRYYWCNGAFDTGVIVHYKDSHGFTRTSP